MSSLENLMSAVDFVSGIGDLTSGEACSSPFCYLEKGFAAKDVLAVAIPIAVRAMAAPRAPRSTIEEYALSSEDRIRRLGVLIC